MRADLILNFLTSISVVGSYCKVPAVSAVPYAPSGAITQLHNIALVVLRNSYRFLLAEKRPRASTSMSRSSELLKLNVVHRRGDLKHQASRLRFAASTSRVRQKSKSLSKTAR